MKVLVRYPIRFLILGTLAALSFGALGKLAPSDPLEAEWGLAISRDLTTLPIEGRLDSDRFPWSDTRTDSNAPLLLSRWYRTEFAPAQRFRFRDFRTDDMKKLDRSVRSAIANEQSAANLFDLVRGRVDYPLAKEVKKILRSKDAKKLDEWLNFGWAAAATSFPEPNAVSRTIYLPNTGQALDLRIGSSDMKALIAYFYGVVARSKVKVYKTKSLDAATFHLLLTNTLRERFSFVVDVDLSSKTDYRPVAAFESDVRIAPNSEDVFHVTTTVEYASRRLPQKDPYGFLFNQDTDVTTYEYTLTVDAEGKIIGSAWIGARPDFAWRVKELPPVDGEFSALRRLYEEAPFEGSTEN